jgi:hypothetical protein
MDDLQTAFARKWFINNEVFFIIFDRIEMSEVIKWPFLYLEI